MNRTLVALCTLIVACGPLSSSDDGGPAMDAAPSDGASCEAQPDRPDHLLEDTNCDGIDGDRADAIFVAPTGFDIEGPTVGGPTTPVRTIGFALALASARGLSQVLVATGIYRERVTVVEGIGIFGGYAPDAGWRRALGTEDVTRILAETPALVATNVAAETVLGGLEIESFDRKTRSASSIAVRVEHARGIVLEDCTLIAGRGGTGVDGMPHPTAAPSGGAGQAGPPGRYLTNLGGGLVGAGNFNVAQPVAFLCAGACGPLSWSSPLVSAQGGVNACGCEAAVREDCRSCPTPRGRTPTGSACGSAIRSRAAGRAKRVSRVSTQDARRIRHRATEVRSWCRISGRTTDPGAMRAG